MFRRTFQKTGVGLDRDPAHLAVPPLLRSMGSSALFLACSLSAPMVVGSPITTPTGTDGDFRTSSLIAGVAQSRPEFAPFSSTPFMFMEEPPAKSVNGSATSPPEAPGGESYPYLLLTAGLVLLAFRPAHSAMTGRP